MSSGIYRIKSDSWKYGYTVPKWYPRTLGSQVSGLSNSTACIIHNKEGAHLIKSPPNEVAHLWQLVVQAGHQVEQALSERPQLHLKLLAGGLRVIQGQTSKQVLQECPGKLHVVVVLTKMKDT